MGYWHSILRGNTYYEGWSQPFTVLSSKKGWLIDEIFDLLDFCNFQVWNNVKDRNTVHAQNNLASGAASFVLDPVKFLRNLLNF